MMLAAAGMLILKRWFNVHRLMLGTGQVLLVGRFGNHQTPERDVRS